MWQQGWPKTGVTSQTFDTQTRRGREPAEKRPITIPGRLLYEAQLMIPEVIDHGTARIGKSRA